MSKMIESNSAVYWPLPVILCILGAVYLSLWQKSSDSKLPLPPQPRGSLMLGNLSEVIKASTETLQHLLMQGWAQEYGEIFRVRLGPVTEYFLNSDQAVKVCDGLIELE
jgi:hypothetical protein